MFVATREFNLTNVNMKEMGSQEAGVGVHFTIFAISLNDTVLIHQYQIIK